MDRLDGLKLNGHPTERLHANLNLSFAGVEGESLMMAHARRGRQLAARPARRATPNRAMSCWPWGWTRPRARASLRFGLGRFTTAEEVEFAIDYGELGGESPSRPVGSD